MPVRYPGNIIGSLERNTTASANTIWSRKSYGSYIGTSISTSNTSASGVWSTVQSTQKKFSSTWPSVDPSTDYYLNLLHIHADGIDGTGNYNHSNYVGETVVSDKVPFPGTYSVYFDGSGDYLTTVTNATAFDQDVDFTLEFWFYALALPGSFDAKFWSPNGAALAPNLGTDGKIYVDDQQTGNVMASLSAINLNTWYHVALVRNGPTTNNLTLYLNGAVQQTLSYTNWQSGMSSVVIGRRTDVSVDFNGYISNMRWVRGTAVYTGAFTPPTSPLTAITNTQFLSCQSETISDRSTNAFTIAISGTPAVTSGTIAVVRSGGVGQGSFSPYMQPPGYWSTYFDGSSAVEYYNIPSSLSIGPAGDCTIELWFYSLANQDAADYIFNKDGASGTNVGEYTFKINGTTLTFSTGDSNGATEQNYTWGTISNGAWAHLAAVRVNTTWYLYINGVLQNAGGTAQTVAPVARNSNLVVGGQFGGNRSYGYVSNFRIVVGTAVYTSNFTPPTKPLTAITNTRFLGFQDNIYIEKANNYSVNTFTIGTTTSSPSIKPEHPFPVMPQIDYSSGYGGSLHFNVNDYLSIPASNNFTFGTGDWTIEAWVNIFTGTSTGNIFDNRTGTSTTHPTLYIAGRQLRMYMGVADQITSGSTLLLYNTWTHVALCKNSGFTRMFINGTQVGSTYTDTNNYAASGPVLVGTGYAGANALTGYIADLRVIKGSGIYTRPFTVPSSSLPTISGSSAAVLQLKGNNGNIIDQTGRNVFYAFPRDGVYLSSTQKKFGPSSLYFDGATALQAFYDSARFDWWRTEFTIEFWLYASTATGLSAIISNADYNSTNNYWSVGVNSSRQVTWYYYWNPQGTTTTTTETINLNAWNHIAVTHIPGTGYRIWVNGVGNAATTLVADGTSSTGTRLTIGAYNNTYMTGYLDEIRISKTARYSANFTPSSTPFANR
jgi:hypothetical protein